MSILWGDGTAADTTTGVVSLVGGTAVATTFRVSGSHTFTAPGVFTVMATVTDADPSSITVSTTITVTAPVTAAGATANLPEGVPEDGEVVATFIDPNPKATFTVTIDSENPAITASNPTVSATGSSSTYVVYADLEGNDMNESGPERDGGGLLLTITDTNDNQVALAASQVNLFDPVLVDPPVNVSAQVGNSFQATVASFSTTDLTAPTSEFTAVVNWGDGQTTDGAIVANGTGKFLVVGSHAYSQTGVFSVSTTIRDDEGQAVSDTSTAAVSGPPLVAKALTIKASPRRTFSGSVATFTGSSFATAAEYSVLINWGDGSTSAGVVQAVGSAPRGKIFAVLGSHTFARHKTYRSSVSIVESGGGPGVEPIVTNIQPGGRAAIAATTNGRKLHVKTPKLRVASAPTLHGQGHQRAVVRAAIHDTTPGTTHDAALVAIAVEAVAWRAYRTSTY